MNLATWWNAIKAFLASVGQIAWIVKRFLTRKDAREAEMTKDTAHEAVRDLDPDRLGDRLRRGVHRP